MSDDTDPTNNPHARRAIATLDLGDGFTVVATVPVASGEASNVSLFFALEHEGSPRGWLTVQQVSAVASMLAARSVTTTDTKESR